PGGRRDGTTRPRDRRTGGRRDRTTGGRRGRAAGAGGALRAGGPGRSGHVARTGEGSRRRRRTGRTTGRLGRTGGPRPIGRRLRGDDATAHRGTGRLGGGRRCRSGGLGRR